MASYSLEHSQDKNPLVDYAIKNMWGNPELDKQHQIKLARISGVSGLVNDFSYMGKTRLLPDSKRFYHVFTLGGLDIGFWNLNNRGNSWYPYDGWTTAAEYSKTNGVSLDFYMGYGELFPRAEVWIMPCFNGPTLVAIPVNKNYSLPLNKNFYLRCYTIDINLSSVSSEEKDKYSFGYFGCIYSEQSDFVNAQASYNLFESYGLGLTLFVHNGVVKDIKDVSPESKDLIEVYYDPSVEMVYHYNYNTLPDYFSTLDSKRKVILFPGFDNRPRKYRYYDDCDFYVYNRVNKTARYYHRNSEDAVRQITHQDYGLSSQYVDTLIDQLINDDGTKKTTESDIDIMVVYRKTKWSLTLGPTSSRIDELYLLESPDKIIRAMTGSNSNVTEWSAAELEKSSMNTLLNIPISGITTSLVRDALDYHGCSSAISDTPLYMPYINPGNDNYVKTLDTPPFTSGFGYKIPPTYVECSTAYEYDENGLLLRVVGVTNQENYLPQEGCHYVEWALGKATTYLDYVISKNDVKLREGYGFRVYRASWAIDPDYKNEQTVSQETSVTKSTSTSSSTSGSEIAVDTLTTTAITDTDDEVMPEGGYPVGDWVDITDTTDYEIVNGYVVFKFDTINNVGLVVSDYAHLYNQFDLTHIDNSMTFQITHKWTIGGLSLPIEPAQIDIWMNKHPLIENIDYVLDFPNVYIINKMWMVGETNHFEYRGTGLSKNGLVNTSELGFVSDGVIGQNGRYNVRGNRPTKTIVGGRLYITGSLDWDEDINHGNNLFQMNGWPYEVKHIYTPIKYTEEYNTYWGYDETLERDKRVADYLTEYVDYKPSGPVATPYLDKDRYRLFSPFLSQIVNEVKLGFLVIPDPASGDVPYTTQQIKDLTQDYQWMLKFDPVYLEMDMRYFTVQPYSNWNKVSLTPNQLTFVNMVNSLFLKDIIKIEGHFEVTHV